MSDYRPDHLARLEPNYLSKYHMHAAPFAASHEDRFLYLDAARSERLALLNHMTQFSNLLLIVMGEAGVGKTSLLQRFVVTAQVDWRICQITANTMIDAEQLLFTAAQGYGLQQLPNDAVQLQEMLYARLATLHRQEQVPILIIHAAHTLPKEALLAVFNLADAQVEQGNLIRIILSCEPQIEKILQAKDVRALRERITHTMEIPPLDEAGTAEYIKHRMAAAGFDGITPFTPKVVKKIFKTSQGVPLRINELAHQVLEHGVDSSTLEDEIVLVEAAARRSYKTMVLITLAAVVAVIVFVYQKQINALFEDKTLSATPEASPVIAPIATPPAKQEKVIPLAPVAVAPAVTEPVSATPVATPAGAPTVAPPAASITTEESPPAITIDIRSLEPAVLSPSTTAQSVTIYGQGFTPDSKVMVSWSGHERTLRKEQVKFINDTELRINIITGSTPDKWTVQVIDPKFGKTKRMEFAVGHIKPISTPVTVAPVVNKVAGIHDVVWIKQQAAQHYTLQLFGSRTQNAAQAFIQQHQLKGDVAIFHARKQGGDWYSVITGSYDTQQAAQQATTQLPVAIQKAKPWVRRFDAVMAEVIPEKAASATTTTSKKPTAAETTKPAKPTIVAPTDSMSHVALTQHEAWLWSQDPRYFTLQLLVSQHVDNVERFITQHAILRAKAAYFRSHSKGRELYTVVYGVYATQQQAETASAQLPAELRAVKPHVRHFGSIHAELERTGTPIR